jgi:hypothetical protein
VVQALLVCWPIVFVVRSLDARHCWVRPVVLRASMALLIAAAGCENTYCHGPNLGNIQCQQLQSLPPLPPLPVGGTGGAINDFDPTPFRGPSPTTAPSGRANVDDYPHPTRADGG